MHDAPAKATALRRRQCGGGVAPPLAIAVFAVLAAAAAGGAAAQDVVCDGATCVYGGKTYKVEKVQREYAAEVFCNPGTDLSSPCRMPWWGSTTLAEKWAMAVNTGAGVYNTPFGPYGPLFPYNSSKIMWSWQLQGASYVNSAFYTEVSTYDIYALATLQAGGGGGSDPHLQGFFGHRYSFCDDGVPCMGRAFSLLSAAAHALNARVTRMAGPDRWPWAGTWMTALGFRFASVLSIELELATDVQYAVRPDGRGPDTTTAEIPRDWAGVFAGVRVNGKDAATRIGSGDTMRFGAASVHFPAARHKSDESDGPVLVVTTPEMQVTMYLESEDVTHLDFAVTLLNGVPSEPVHGLLGQSLTWAVDAPAAIAGSELEYAVEGGLLGTAFKYTAFTGLHPAAKAARRDTLGREAAGPLTGRSLMRLA